MNPPRPPAPASWLPPRTLLNLLLAGVLFRLVALGYWSLWLDEGATWSWAVEPTWAGTIFAEANHPPLWWVVTRLWIEAFGDSEAALRAPAAILGVVAMGLTWFLGLRVLDPAWAPRRGAFPSRDDGGRGRRIAVWFTALVACSAFFLEYAQEARMYTALLVETLGLCLLYLRWLDKNDRLSLVLYALVGALALYTHYFAIWPLLAHAAHAIWLGRRTRGKPDAVRPLPFLLAVAGAGLLFVPWVVYLVTHYEGIADIAPEPFSYVVYVLWRMGAGPGLVVPDRLRQVAGPTSVFEGEWLLIFVVAVLWFIPLILGFVALRHRPGLRSFALANLVLPIALLLAIYPLFPLIHERYLIFLAPWVFLLVVLGAFSTPRIVRPLILGGVVLLTTTGVVAYHGASDVLVPVGCSGTLDGRPAPEAFLPDPNAPLAFLDHGHPYGREPWRQAHVFVRHHAEPDDLVLLHPWYIHLVWDYYASHAETASGKALEPLETIRLPQELLSPEAILEQYGERLRGRRRVFLVLAHEETEDPDDYYRALQSTLGPLWISEGRGISSVGPILFHLSWGVRVAVFTRQ